MEVESRTGAATVVSRWLVDWAFASSPQSGLAWSCFLFPLIEPPKWNRFGNPSDMPRTNMMKILPTRSVGKVGSQFSRASISFFRWLKKTGNLKLVMQTMGQVDVKNSNEVPAPRARYRALGFERHRTRSAGSGRVVSSDCGTLYGTAGKISPKTTGK
jgi:hypothetical protein